MLSTTTLMTALLLGLQAPAKDSDPDPEPPKPQEVAARLVAKKKTYKLDLGGMTAAKFRDKVKAGGANLPEAPAVELVLVITNNTKNAIRIRTAGSTNRVSVKVTGPNVATAIVKAVMPGQPRQPMTYVVLKPKSKVEIPIDRLVSKTATTRQTRYYWTEPGEYTLTASLYTLVVMNWIEGVGGARAQYMTLKTGSIKVKVEK